MDGWWMGLCQVRVAIESQKRTKKKRYLSQTRFELVTLCVLSTRDNQLHHRDCDGNDSSKVCLTFDGAVRIASSMVLA